MKPDTDIWIFPDYPYGWHAVVGSEGFFNIFYAYEDGRVRAMHQQKPAGFEKNGAPMIDWPLEFDMLKASKRR